MARPEEPYAPTDDQLLVFFANHYTIMAICACGHERELHTRPLQRQLGIGANIGRLRSCLRCHKCQARRPGILVRRMPR
jgi:hypothetical protein